MFLVVSRSHLHFYCFIEEVHWSLIGALVCKPLMSKLLCSNNALSLFTNQYIVYK